MVVRRRNCNRSDDAADHANARMDFHVRPRSKLYIMMTTILILLITVVGLTSFTRNIVPRIAESEWARASNQILMEARNRVMSLNEGIQGRKLSQLPRTVSYDDLLQMNTDERKSLIQNSYDGTLLISPDENHLHGKIGISLTGTPLYTPTVISPDEMAEMNVSHELHEGGGFNLRISDSISLDRVPVDNRSRECRGMEWNIPAGVSASVVIIFYNEAKTTLLRSIYSVLNQTRPELLDEIILVDDASTVEWIAGPKSELEYFVRHMPKVRLITKAKRTGIVDSRTIGIKAVTSQIFVILDSHIEVQPHWIEPLLHRISESEKSIVMPAIDGLDARNFNYKKGGIGCTLGFIWKLMEHGYYAQDFKNSTLSDRLDAKSTDFVSSPTMAGGLFAANKNYFLNELEGYDGGFTFWGAENLELSFRTWMCGGRIECSACSRVFHVFRSGGSAYSSPHDALALNKLRLMDSWMDGYADIPYQVLGRWKKDYGDTSAIHEFKKRKNCMNFQWYLDNVWPESYIRSRNDLPYLGTIQNIGSGRFLQATAPGSPNNSNLNLASSNGTEFMYFRIPKRITTLANDENCLTVENSRMMDWCHQRQDFEHDVISEPSGNVQIVNANGKCLTDHNGTVMWETCDNSQNQKWKWASYIVPEKSPIAREKL